MFWMPVTPLRMLRRMLLLKLSIPGWMDITPARCSW